MKKFLVCTLVVFSQVVQVVQGASAADKFGYPGDASDVPCAVFGSVDAAHSDDLATSKIILSNSDASSINTVNEAGYTPLLLACGKSDTDLVRLLLEKGAVDSINRPNQVGDTPLLVACWKRNIDLVRLLLKNGANTSIDKQNAAGYTPLIYACEIEYMDLAELLLNNGAAASMNVYSICNTFPVLHACSVDNFPLVELLLKNGAAESINKRNTAEYTPLFCACDHQNINLVRLLLEHGAVASINMPNEDGVTPWQRALLDKNDLIIRMLFDKMISTKIGLESLGVKNKDGKLPEEFMVNPELKALKARMCTLRESYKLFMINVEKNISKNGVLLKKLKLVAEHIASIGATGGFSEAQVAQALRINTDLAIIELREKAESVSHSSRVEVLMCVQEILDMLNARAKGPKGAKPKPITDIKNKCKSLLKAYRSAQAEIGDEDLARSIMNPLNAELRKLQNKKDGSVDAEMNWGINFPQLVMEEPVPAAANAGAGVAAAAVVVLPDVTLFDAHKAELDLGTLGSLLKAMKRAKTEVKTKHARQYAIACGSFLDGRINTLANAAKAARLAAKETEAIVANEENPDLGATEKARKRNRKIFRDKCWKFVERYPLDKTNGKTAYLLGLLKDALDEGVDTKIIHGLLRYGPADLRRVYADIIDVESSTEHSTYDSRSFSQSQISPGAGKIDLLGVCKFDHRLDGVEEGDADDRSTLELDVGDLSDFSDSEEEGDALVLRAGAVIPFFALPDSLACEMPGVKATHKVTHANNLETLRKLFDKEQWSTLNPNGIELEKLVAGLGSRFIVDNKSKDTFKIIDTGAAKVLVDANKASISVDRIHSRDMKEHTGGPKKRLLRGVVKLFINAGIDPDAVDRKYGGAS